MEGPTKNFSTRLERFMSIEFLELVVGPYLRTSVFPPNGARKLIWDMGPTSLPDVKILTGDRGVKPFMISKLFSTKLEVRLVNITALTLWEAVCVCQVCFLLVCPGCGLYWARQ